MKKQLLKIICAMLVAATVMSFSGCGGFVTGEGVGKDVISDIDDVTQLSSITTYEVVPESDSNENQITQVGTAMSDGKYNYFCFKLGRVNNVPIHYENAYLHNGTTKSTYEWSSSVISADSYTNAKSNTVEFATKVSTSVSTSAEVGIKGGVKYGGFEAGISTNVKTSVTSAAESKGSYLSEESFTNKVQDTLETKQSRTIEIAKDAPKGFYRYVIYTSFDVYVTLVCDRVEKTVSYEYSAEPVETKMYDTFLYSEENDFDEVDPTDKLTFTEDMLNGLGIDLFSTEIKVNLPYGKSYEYENLNKKTIYDDGSYGLHNPEKNDRLDLSEFEPFFSDEYKFIFKIKIHSETKKTWGIFDNEGYHEIHLYKDKPNATNDPLDDELASKNYGWICGEEWVQSDGFNDIEFTVDGNQCDKEMYLLYDAHGKNDDTWYLNQLYVTVTVERK